MRTLPGLNISQLKLNLHAVLLRFINFWLLFGEAILFIFTLKMLLELTLCCSSVCLSALRVEADCHSHAESLIFHEENTTEADKPTKRYVISDISSKLSFRVNLLYLDVWLKMPKFFHHLFILKLFYFYILDTFKVFSHFEFVAYTLIKNWDLVNLRTYANNIFTSSN